MQSVARGRALRAGHHSADGVRCCVGTVASHRRSFTALRWLGAWAMWLTLAACRASSSESVTPSAGGDVSSDGPAPRGSHEGETSLELEARVERLRGRQRALAAVSMSDATVCEEVCSLATSICGVQEKLCNIADEHPQEDSYQALCREAKLECQAAQEACVACVERHTAQPSTPRR